MSVQWGNRFRSIPLQYALDQLDSGRAVGQVYLDILERNSPEFAEFALMVMQFAVKYR